MLHCRRRVAFCCTPEPQSPGDLPAVSLTQGLSGFMIHYCPFRAPVSPAAGSERPPARSHVLDGPVILSTSFWHEMFPVFRGAWSAGGVSGRRAATETSRRELEQARIGTGEDVDTRVSCFLSYLPSRPTCRHLCVCGVTGGPGTGAHRVHGSELAFRGWE